MVHPLRLIMPGPIYLSYKDLRESGVRIRCGGIDSGVARPPPPAALWESPRGEEGIGHE